MTDKARELLERALEGLNWYEYKDLMEEIRAYLAEPTQDEEPVAWMKEDEDGDLEFNTLNQFSCGRSDGIPLYLHPAPRKLFVRLSEEEIESILMKREGTFGMEWLVSFARAIEDALEKAND